MSTLFGQVIPFFICSWVVGQIWMHLPTDEEDRAEPMPSHWHMLAMNCLAYALAGACGTDFIRAMMHFPG